MQNPYIIDLAAFGSHVLYDSFKYKLANEYQQKYCSDCDFGIENIREICGTISNAFIYKFEHPKSENAKHLFLDKFLF